MKVFQRTQCIATRFARSRASTFAVICGLVLLVTSGAAAATLFTVTNLVSDDPVGHPAKVIDARLANAWGISASATSPFWVSSNGQGVAEIYSVNPATNAVSIAGLSPITIPSPLGGTAAVTGQVFAGISGAFNNDLFIFATEDGTIAGWRGALGTTGETLFISSNAANYKGITLGLVNNEAYLYAADFHNNRIEVLPQAGAPALPGNFTDPTLPSGFAPFNVANLGGTLYVAYAEPDTNPAHAGDEVDGPGLGYVSAFDLRGNFLRRVASDAALNAPWGLAIAPASFGEFAGDLLVGNFGDGFINAFNASTGAPLGQLRDTSGTPLQIDGLWGLLPGNNASGGGSANDIYFAAGPDGETHGLFGVIAPVGPAAAPEPPTVYVLGIALIMLAWAQRSRSAAPSVSTAIRR